MTSCRPDRTVATPPWPSICGGKRRSARSTSANEREPPPQASRQCERRETTMRVVDAIAQILKREGVEFLSCYPTTIMIEAAAEIGIRPILCRQERVGVDI